jgi:hypothetical protein
MKNAAMGKQISSHEELINTHETSDKQLKAYTKKWIVERKRVSQNAKLEEEARTLTQQLQSMYKASRT